MLTISCLLPMDKHSFSRRKRSCAVGLLLGSGCLGKEENVSWRLWTVRSFGFHIHHPPPPPTKKKTKSQERLEQSQKDLLVLKEKQTKVANVFSYCTASSGAVKLVLWRFWRHVTQVNPVSSENQFHCTGVYMFWNHAGKLSTVAAWPISTDWSVHKTNLPAASLFWLGLCE